MATKYDLPSTSTWLDKFSNYQSLFVIPTADKTAEQITEFATLQSELEDYLMSASDFNGKLDGSEVVTGSTPNKIIQLDSNGEIPMDVISERILYGETVTGSTTIANPDNITKCGYYTVTPAITIDGTLDFWLINHMQTYGLDNNWALQIASTLQTTGKLYCRWKLYGIWQAWGKLWNANNDGSGSGLDADKLDNIESERFPYGTNSTANTVVTFANINNIVKSGFYTTSDTGTIGISDYWNIIHTEYGNQFPYSCQIAMSVQNDGVVYIRWKLNTVWQSWKKMWHEGNGADRRNGGHSQISMTNGDGGVYSISIGSGYVQGKLIFYDANIGKAVAFFSTDENRTIIIKDSLKLGGYDMRIDGNPASTAELFTMDNAHYFKKIYINGSNIEIRTDGARTTTAEVDWEVWK